MLRRRLARRDALLRDYASIPAERDVFRVRSAAVVWARPRVRPTGISRGRRSRRPIRPPTRKSSSLGRNLSNGANGTVNIELIQPGTMYGPRQQSVDFRLSQRTRIGSRRAAINLDLYNLLNSAGIATVNATYGPAWQRPTLVQLARYVKIGVQIDF